MKKLFLIIMALLAILTARATPQARDVLYWNGNKYFIIPTIDIEKRMNSSELNNLNTAKTAAPPTSNYRGYSLEFEIYNDTLYLKAIKDTDNMDLSEFVFGNLSPKPIIDFSDTLFLGYGSFYYDPAWWTMVNESEITVVFKNGVVQWVKDNKSKSKSSLYSPLDIAYFKKLYSNIHWSGLNQETLKKKPTVVLRIENDSIDTPEKVAIQRSSGFVDFDKEAVRVVKTISLPVSFVKGSYLHHNYQVPIVFDAEKAKKLGVYNETAKTNDIFEDKLVLLLQDCIKESKNKYEDSSYLAHKNRPLLFCSDGMPITYAEQNKSFYESLGLRTMSWYNTKMLQKRMIREMDVMEVHYYLKGNIFEVYIYFLTATKENNEISLAYRFESVDKYVYENSCETNEWHLIKKE